MAQRDRIFHSMESEPNRVVESRPCSICGASSCSFWVPIVCSCWEILKEWFYLVVAYNREPPKMVGLLL